MLDEKNFSKKSIFIILVPIHRYKDFWQLLQNPIVPKIVRGFSNHAQRLTLPYHLDVENPLKLSLLNVWFGVTSAVKIPGTSQPHSSPSSKVRVTSNKSFQWLFTGTFSHSLLSCWQFGGLTATEANTQFLGKIQWHLFKYSGIFSNTVVCWPNIMVFGSNILVFRATSIYLGNLQSKYRANKLVCWSNTGVFWSHTVGFYSNKMVFGSYTVIFGTNTVVFWA